jgi:predicted metallopeptidase
MKKIKNQRLEWEEAPDVSEKINIIIKLLDFSNVKSSNIHCYRTKGSKSKAYARIWAMPKIFQKALNIEPHYVIEVISKYFDNLTDDEKSKVLIHELLHIPNNFSGALVPHNTKSRNLTKLANSLFIQYKNKQI